MSRVLNQKSYKDWVTNSTAVGTTNQVRIVVGLNPQNNNYLCADITMTYIGDNKHHSGQGARSTVVEKIISVESLGKVNVNGDCSNGTLLAQRMVKVTTTKRLMKFK